MSNQLELPKELTLPCCPGKSCGMTSLYLDGTYKNNELVYVYKRSSNGEDYSPALNLVDMDNWVDEQLKNPATSQSLP